MKSRTALRIFIGSLILLTIWIVAAPFLARNLIVERPLKHADAILVLSGSAAYIERTRMAAEMYNRGVADKVLLTDDGELSGWSPNEERNPPFVYLAKNELIASGVPESKIEVIPPQVTGTIYEARALKAKIKREKWNSVLLVTSRFHTKRALRTFERTNTDVRIGIVYAETGPGSPSENFWWLSPQGWQTVGAEYVKLAVYWLFY